MSEENQEKEVNQFTLFFHSYARYQYGGLWKAMKLCMLALFARQDPEGWNPYTVYDHGLVWRLLRDLYIAGTTAIRFVFGVLTLLVLPPAVIALALLRALYIPVRGLYLAWKQAITLRRLQRARAKQSSQ